jgi:hypothetical protein
LQESITANFSFLAQKKLDNLPITLAAFAEDSPALGTDPLAYPKMQTLNVLLVFSILDYFDQYMIDTDKHHMETRILYFMKKIEKLRLLIS